MSDVWGVRSHASWVRNLAFVSWQRSREWSCYFFWTRMVLYRRVGHAFGDGVVADLDGVVADLDGGGELCVLLVLD